MTSKAYTNVQGAYFLVYLHLKKKPGTFHLLHELANKPAVLLLCPRGERGHTGGVTCSRPIASIHLGAPVSLIMENAPQHSGPHLDIIKRLGANASVISKLIQLMSM
jgi:hypothetical protein